MSRAARALHWRNQHAFIPCLKGLGNPLKLLRDWDRELQLFPLNEEFLVSMGHKLILITSLPFVHTARRYYRLVVLLRYMDSSLLWFSATDWKKCITGLRLEEVKVVTRFP